jgi:hypothetical protein
MPRENARCMPGADGAQVCGFIDLQSRPSCWRATRVFRSCNMSVAFRSTRVSINSEGRVSINPEGNQQQDACHGAGRKQGACQAWAASKPRARHAPCTMRLPCQAWAVCTSRARHASCRPGPQARHIPGTRFAEPSGCIRHARHASCRRRQRKKRPAPMMGAGLPFG